MASQNQLAAITQGYTNTLLSCCFCVQTLQTLNQALVSSAFSGGLVLEQGLC